MSIILAHLIQASLQLLVLWVDTHDDLQAFVALALDNFTEQSLKLVILVIPCVEDQEASYHDLQEKDDRQYNMAKHRKKK